jgi:hypothetical protein
MYLIIAKLWEFVLPLVIGLQAVGNKLPINKCCCRYLWGVIIFTEGRNAIPGTARTEGELDGFWRDKDEEIVALVAAEMHQEPRAWEAVWSKNEGRTDRTFDILSTDEDVEMENTDDVSMSGESASDMRSGPSLKESRSAMTSLESEGSPPEYGRSRPVLTHRWSGEDETWNAMVMYVRNKCGEQKQKHNMEDEMAATRAESGDNRDTIQRRMSISNLL